LFNHLTPAGSAVNNREGGVVTQKGLVFLQ
jgi:hypothetical protein